MNLHAIVRGAINSVNPDRTITWLRSTGYSTSPSGRRIPAYALPVSDVRAQIQPVSGDDLKQIEYLNMQGTFRKVYAFGSLQGIVRPDLSGGDMLQFPLDGVTRSWLVVHVLETWTPDAAGWCCVIAALQDDA